jgi:ferredoxin-type protein NapG
MWFRRRKADTHSDKPQVNRRDLLRGRLWKLVRPSPHKPLVMRYPRTARDLQIDDPAGTQSDAPGEPDAAPTVRTIGGISIDPVAATILSGSPRRPPAPVFRPPGAIEEQRFLDGCTRCSDCADACPYDAIVKAPERLGPIAGTPVIEADSAACMMCEDFPCITACAPAVLVHSIPKAMGTAKVTEHLCLAHHGTTCTVCSERCPVENAIEVNRGRPTVREEVCTGCGVCRYVCPAPENAILLMPTFHRPARPTA